MIMAATTTVVTIIINIKRQAQKGSLKPQIPVSGCFFFRLPRIRARQPENF